MKKDRAKKLNVAVIFGGKSVEHDISIITGVQTLNNLDKQKYNVFPLYITREGKWLYSKNFYDIKVFIKNIDVSKEVLTVNLSSLDSGLYRIVGKKQKLLANIDFAFLATHGANGENGALQGHLEMCSIPYSSCGVGASAICMDKSFTKAFLNNHNISTPNYVCLNGEDSKRGFTATLQKLQQLKYPLIVKPCSLGSSVGINLCKTKTALKNALSFAFLFDDKVLVEEAVDNLREFNIGVIGNSIKQEISDIEEVFSKNEFLTFESKYLNDVKSKGMESTSRKIPAELPCEARQYIEQTALNIFKVLGCKGIVRIDFLFDENKNTVYLNEINTIPGSLANYMWKTKKLSFSKLLDKLLDYAMQEKDLKSKKITNFSSNVLSKFENAQKLEITK